MGIKDMWTDALGLFKYSKPQLIAQIAADHHQKTGKKLRLAVDISILLNNSITSSIDKLATTCIPPYPAPDLYRKIQEDHNEFSKDFVPVYVFDGIAPSIKSDTRDKRRESREKAGKAWFELLARAFKGEKCFTDEEIENATTSRMNMKKPTAIDQAFILVWMKEEDVECVGSLEEADMQCVKLEKDGIVDGIITEDSDMFALGAENLYCKLDRRKKGEYKVQHLNRDYFFHPSNPYKSQLNRHQHNLLDAALLLGNDYVSRIRGNGVGVVVQGSLEEKLPVLPENASQSEKAERKRLLETRF